jgi:hypothetical protein
MKKGSQTTRKAVSLPARAASVRGTKRGAVKAASEKLSAKGLGWLLDRELPPAKLLPENPVLVARRS